jgi:GTP-binding protein
MATDFTSAEINAGRKLFAGDWQFLWAASSLETLPKMTGLEIAFAGRSNVGKSSLINALTGRKSLARTSHTPGRTQELIYFGNDGPMRLVDMPGYGYAEAPKQKVEEWTTLIHSYLRGRANLARVYVLIDARHGLKDSDKPALDALGDAAVSHQIVLTKADQIKPKELEDRLSEIGALISRRAAAFPGLLVTSALKGPGIPELRAAVARLVAERKR